MMNWCNPEVWSDEKNYGIDEIRGFADHFHTPLHVAGYDGNKVMKEWKSVQRHVKENLLGRTTSEVWKSILIYKKTEYPNLCLLLRLVYCLSGSNSSVERAFSILTAMLSDRRLNSSHKLLEMRMFVQVNDKNWKEKEREDILKRALEIYTTIKSRKRKLAVAAPSDSIPAISLSSDDKASQSESDDADSEESSSESE